MNLNDSILTSVSASRPGLGRIVANVVDLQSQVVNQFETISASLESIQIANHNAMMVLRDDIRRMEDRAQKQMDELRSSHDKTSERLHAIIKQLMTDRSALIAQQNAAPQPTWDYQRPFNPMQFTQPPQAQNQINPAVFHQMQQQMQHDLQRQMQQNFQAQALQLLAQQQGRAPMFPTTNPLLAQMLSAAQNQAQRPQAQQETTSAGLPTPQLPVQLPVAPQQVPPMAQQMNQEVRAVRSPPPPQVFAQPNVVQVPQLFNLQRPQQNAPLRQAPPVVDFPAVAEPVNADDADDNPENFQPQVDVVPVYPLPDRVQLVTGEENEQATFESMCRLFVYAAETNEWKERGRGVIKILKNNESGKCRVVMRRDQIHNLCANHPLVAGISIGKKSGNDRAMMWFCKDFADGDEKIQKFSARFPTAEAANLFKTEFDAGVRAAATAAAHPAVNVNQNPENLARNAAVEPAHPLPEEVPVVDVEENEQALFESTCRLFAVTDIRAEERGRGTIKILRNKESGRCRVTMRRDQIQTLCVNHPLVAGMLIQKKAGNENAVTWMCNDFASGAEKPENFTALFQTLDEANVFMTLFQEAPKEVTGAPVVGVSFVSAPTVTRAPEVTIPAQWDCPDCYVENAGDSKTCVCCGAKNELLRTMRSPVPQTLSSRSTAPATTAPVVASTITFGLPPSSPKAPTATSTQATFSGFAQASSSALAGLPNRTGFAPTCSVFGNTQGTSAATKSPFSFKMHEKAPFSFGTTEAKSSTAAPPSSTAFKIPEPSKFSFGQKTTAPSPFATPASPFNSFMSAANFSFRPGSSTPSTATSLGSNVTVRRRDQEAVPEREQDLVDDYDSDEDAGDDDLDEDEFEGEDEDEYYDEDEEEENDDVTQAMRRL